jgi:hypothetical protein
MLDRPISDAEFNEYSNLQTEARVIRVRAERIAQLLVEEFAPDSASRLTHGVEFAPGEGNVVAMCRTIFGEGRIRLVIGAKNRTATGRLIVERVDEDSFGRAAWKPVWNFHVPSSEKLVIGTPPNARWYLLYNNSIQSHEDAIYALGMSINYAIAAYAPE